MGGREVTQGYADRLVRLLDDREAQVARLRHERDLLADALGRLLVRLGCTGDVPASGPQLLAAAEAVCDGPGASDG